MDKTCGSVSYGNIKLKAVCDKVFWLRLTLDKTKVNFYLIRNAAKCSYSVFLLNQNLYLMLSFSCLGYSNEYYSCHVKPKHPSTGCRLFRIQLWPKLSTLCAFRILVLHWAMCSWAGSRLRWTTTASICPQQVPKALWLGPADRSWKQKEIEPFLQLHHKSGTLCLGLWDHWTLDCSFL